MKQEERKNIWEEKLSKKEISAIFEKLKFHGWNEWDDPDVLTDRERKWFEWHLKIEEKKKEPPCGLCKHCQQLKLLEYDDDENYIGPALKYVCMHKDSKKYFTMLKFGALEFRCKLWEDINKH